MKNKYLKFTFGYFSLIWIFFLYSNAFSQEKFDVKNTESILISAAMLKLQDLPKPKGDESLLITDKIEIAKLVKLFDGNQKSRLHACGYQWRITFVRSSDEPVDIWFNEQCEEFARNTEEICKIVQEKFRQVKENPTHFIIEVGIDVNISPSEAIEKLKANQNLSIFVLGNLDKRFPSIEIEATAISVIPENRALWNKAKDETRSKAEIILTEEYKRIGQNFAVLKKGEFQFNKSMFGGGKIEETPRMKIFFQVGINLDGIEKHLSNTKFVSKNEPKVYFLQIVSKNRFSDSIARQLSDNFSFIKQTFAYTAYPR